MYKEVKKEAVYMELLENMSKEDYNWILNILKQNPNSKLALKVKQGDKIVSTVRIELDSNGKLKII